MTLGEVIGYIDAGTDIRIYQNTRTVGEDWEIVYEGAVSDVPWTLLKFHLIERQDNEDSEAICPYIDKKGCPCLRITLGD
jgi:hypothetical protein